MLKTALLLYCFLVGSDAYDNRQSMRAPVLCYDLTPEQKKTATPRQYIYGPSSEEIKDCLKKYPKSYQNGLDTQKARQAGGIPFVDIMVFDGWIVKDIERRNFERAIASIKKRVDVEKRELEIMQGHLDEQAKEKARLPERIAEREKSAEENTQSYLGMLSRLMKSNFKERFSDVLRRERDGEDWEFPGGTYIDQIKKEAHCGTKDETDDFCGTKGTGDREEKDYRFERQQKYNERLKTYRSAPCAFQKTKECESIPDSYKAGLNCQQIRVLTRTPYCLSIDMLYEKTSAQQYVDEAQQLRKELRAPTPLWILKRQERCQSDIERLNQVLDILKKQTHRNKDLRHAVGIMQDLQKDTHERLSKIDYEQMV